MKLLANMMRTGSDLCPRARRTDRGLAWAGWGAVLCAGFPPGDAVAQSCSDQPAGTPPHSDRGAMGHRLRGEVREPELDPFPPDLVNVLGYPIEYSQYPAAEWRTHRHVH